MEQPWPHSLGRTAGAALDLSLESKAEIRRIEGLLTKQEEVIFDNGNYIFTMYQPNI